jgi:hypothetical protein
MMFASPVLERVQSLRDPLLPLKKLGKSIPGFVTSRCRSVAQTTDVGLWSGMRSQSAIELPADL